MQMHNTFNTDLFINNAWDFLQQILFTPQSMREFFLSFVIGFLVLAICLAKAHILGNSARNSIFFGLFIALIGSAILLATASISQIYVIPFISSQAYDQKLLLGCVGIVFLIIVLPMTRSIFRSGYMTSLIAWCVAVIVAGVLIYGVHTFVQPGLGDKPPTCPFTNQIKLI